MKKKTLTEYAAEVAAIIGGKVLFTGPYSASIANHVREITLDGPRCKNWNVINQTIIAGLRADLLPATSRETGLTLDGAESLGVK